jgi:hypothetical protein
MGTLRDYFESDNKDLSIQRSSFAFSSEGIKTPNTTIICRIHLSAEAHSKFITLYSEKAVNFKALLKHLENDNLRNCDVFSLLGNSINKITVGKNDSDPVSVEDLVFTKKIIIYVNLKLTDEQKKVLIAHGQQQGLKLEVRDIEYAEKKSITEKPLAFISHAKSDGREFAIKLANGLTKLGCPVWFDEYSMTIGDNLLESIEKGLKETDKCIFILTPDFLANEGWCKHEFNTASMKQIFEKKDVILPIWHGVTQEQVYDYSAALYNKLGRPSTIGVDKIAQEISKLLLNPKPI